MLSQCFGTDNAPNLRAFGLRLTAAPMMDYLRPLVSNEPFV